MKSHLKRVIGNAHLTYEEFYTIITQIEAILNCRPLYSLSSESSDLEPLTPGHFLIGQPLITIPENRLSSYQKLQKLIQHFWDRWSLEYIHHLQVRTKWKTQAPTMLKEDALVLMSEDNQPSLKWTLGRIAKLHYGKDNIARVDIKTSNGTITRPVVKLCVFFAI